MSSVLDSRHRPLTPAERRQQQAVMPALRAWTAYLTATSSAPTGSFERAQERRSGVILRHTPNSNNLKPPVAVSPDWAYEWAIRNGHRGTPGSGSPLTVGLMVDALDFMRATPARTFCPVIDSHGRRRRDGFFHLTAEMHDRLHGGNYRPVLTPRPGRPVADRKPAPRAISGRAMRRGDDDPTLSIVRDWVRITEATALYSTASRERRPLAVRSPGRPSTSGRRGAGVARAYVLGTVEALAWHASDHAGRGGWRVPSTSELITALAVHAEVTPDVLIQVSRFSTPDAPRQRHVRGWWRFMLAPLGCGPLDTALLQDEIDHWQAQQDRPAQPVADPTRNYHGLTLPADVDPAQLDDPEYRDFAGVSDDDYERWKAGQ